MRRYGLIGFPLSHSFSQKYFSEKFEREHIADADFVNYSIPQIEDVETIFSNEPSLQGLAVTIPYKKSIIPYLDQLSETVQQINACNCIRINKGKKSGHNTDIIGFEKSFIKKLQPHHKKALILGTGGASMAVEFVLQKMGIEYLFVSRNEAANTIIYDDLQEEIFHHYNIIINCTPLGTFPNIDDAPVLPYQFINKSNYLFDLVYNPPLTRFLQYGKRAGATFQNGLDMLEMQAEENWKIWNEHDSSFIG
ncbi:MAG: shikimate dehydrogenase [Bacteroidetes bacterium]|nr:shikimate dehydrogenase [Bacteroidota bacterium]